MYRKVDQPTFRSIVELCSSIRHCAQHFPHVFDGAEPMTRLETLAAISSKALSIVDLIDKCERMEEDRY